MRYSYDNPVTDYWLKYYIEGDACSLCGNSGVIHTEGIRTAAGIEVGRRNFCICPNGQALQKRDAELRVHASDGGETTSAPDSEKSTQVILGSGDDPDTAPHSVSR